MLERELDLTKARIDESVRKLEAHEKRIDFLRDAVAKATAQIREIENPKVPAAGQRVSELDLKFGSGKGQRHFSHRDGGLDDLWVTPDGRYAFAHQRVTKKFLIDNGELIQMEAAPTSGEGPPDHHQRDRHQAGDLGRGLQDARLLDVRPRVQGGDLRVRRLPRAPAGSTLPTRFSMATTTTSNCTSSISGRGARLETNVITQRGDTSIAYVGLAPGVLLMCLESGAYVVDVKVKAGTWVEGWKLTTLPEVIARVGKPWTYQPKLLAAHQGISWVLETPPDGMAHNETTGAIKWVPTKAQDRSPHDPAARRESERFGLADSATDRGPRGAVGRGHALPVPQNCPPDPGGRSDGHPRPRLRDSG